MVSSSDEKLVLVTMVATTESDVLPGFEETHFHQFVDVSPGFEISAELLETYSHWADTVDIEHSDPPPTFHGTHPRPGRKQ